MSIPVYATPPDSGENYIIDQLEGERITIPGSKGTFRILASSKQTDGGIAVFQSGAVLSDAPGFHWHEEAHDIFLVLKGFLKLWNGDTCRIMGPGDFAYVPPKIIHNPELLGPHTETLGLIAPGDWVDFFRHVSETFRGVIVPENDSRDLRALLLPKVIAAKDRFDVHFKPDYAPPELGDWLPSESTLPGPLEPYFLRANTGPRWLLGGIMSRPFIRASQCSNKFAISSIESSKEYGPSPLRNRWLVFPNVTHCFYVAEGLLRVRIKDSGGSLEEGNGGWNTAREGQTVVIVAGQAFTLGFGSKYVRTISFTNGNGIEELIHEAGSPFTGFVLPDEPEQWNEDVFRAVLDRFGIQEEASNE